MIRLRDYRSDTTRFITKVKAPFTNNLAERDLRMMRVKQKISGGFSSVEKGALLFLCIRSLISTAKKLQGWDVLNSIIHALSDKKFPSIKTSKKLTISLNFFKHHYIQVDQDLNVIANNQ